METPVAPGKSTAVTAPPSSVDERFASMQAQLDAMGAQLGEARGELGGVKEELKNAQFQLQLTKDKLFASTQSDVPCEWDSEWDLELPAEWQHYIFNKAEKCPAAEWKSFCALFATLARRLQWFEDRRRFDRVQLEWLKGQFGSYVTKRKAMEVDIEKMKEALSLPTWNVDGSVSDLRPMTTLEAEKLRYKLNALKDGDANLFRVQEILGLETSKEGTLSVNLEYTTLEQCWQIHFIVNNFKMKRGVSNGRKKAKPPTHASAPPGVSAPPLKHTTKFAAPTSVHESPPRTHTQSGASGSSSTGGAGSGLGNFDGDDEYGDNSEWQPGEDDEFGGW